MYDDQIMEKFGPPDLTFIPDEIAIAFKFVA
jgi:hypothetical protein